LGDRRITIPSQPRQKVPSLSIEVTVLCTCHPQLCRRLRLEELRFVKPHLNRKKVSKVALACHPSNSRKCMIGELQSRPTWAKVSKTLPPK
jgi:hypothetical protein